jgi:hypothetical protein
MIENTQMQPNMIAYDRPSKLLLSFLNKHYKLASFVPQNNNYVIFDQYFSNDNSAKNTQNKINNSNAPLTNNNINFSSLGKNLLK